MKRLLVKSEKKADEGILGDFTERLKSGYSTDLRD